MVKKISTGSHSTKSEARSSKSAGATGMAGAAAAAMQGLQGLQGMFDKQLAGSVKDSAQQIWLAGMGAFSKAQAGGGKMFETLIKEGLNLQKKTQNMAEEKISEVTGKMSAMAGTVTAKAGENWDRLESIFEARTAKAMNKLGVPTAKDLDALAKRVDELAAAVAKLAKSGARPAVAKKAGAKAGARSAAEVFAKPAAKRTRKTA